LLPPSPSQLQQGQGWTQREEGGGGVRGHRLISYPLSQKVKRGGVGELFFTFYFYFFPDESLKKRKKIMIFFQK
jgi:hypothetical protein